LYVKLVCTVSGECVEGFVVMGWPAPARGVSRPSWMSERFLSGGGGVKLRGGGLNWKGAGVYREEFWLLELLEERLISSQPLLMGVGCGDSGEMEQLDWRSVWSLSVFGDGALEDCWAGESHG
jgi:hypothetical protein